MGLRRELGAGIAPVIVAIGLVAGCVVLPAGPAGAASRWSITKSASPDGPPNGELQAVSCASAADCFAVGDAGNGTLIEHWNGSRWAFVSSPNPKGSFEPSLSAVSCPSATFCFATGDSGSLASSPSGSALIERWDGSSWTIVPSPTVTGGSFTSLSSVSCTSPTSCFAVGSTSTVVTFPTFSITAATVTERWDGASWSIVASPVPSHAIRAQLFGVSCPSVSNCFAVGSYEGRATAGALIEHWDGGTWSIVPSPDALAAAMRTSAITPIAIGFGSSAALNGVSCSNDTNCLAVGTSFEGALAEHWDGATWSIVDVPSPRNAFGVQLLAVSCSSASDCSAVGTAEIDTGNGGGIVVVGDGSPLSEHWNGTTWSIVAQPPGNVFSRLSGVSCPSATSCAAVGDSAFAQHWNGSSWSIALLAAKTSQSRLDQVSCPSATSCFAVGSYRSNTGEHTLVEHWNGSAWSILPSPTPKGTHDVELIGVSCATPTSCFAVGYALTSFAQRPLIERWNGTSWSVVSSPSPKGSEFAELTSVSCPTATSCNAVGFSESETSAGALIERWDGKRWTIVRGAAAPGVAVQLVGVSCPSATDCTAVGSSSANTQGETFNVKPLAEHFDGTSWSIVPTVAPAGASFVTFITVSCSSASDCLAVGVKEASLIGGTRPLTEHWNGTSWTIVATPSPSGSLGAELVGVSCRSARSCYVVGGSFTASRGKTLVEHWNGTALTVVPSPSPTSGSDTALTSVSCPTSASCTAVGSFNSRNGSFTLTERGS